jgi:hypothetical protein
VSPNKVKYFPGCLQVCPHHKLEWKEDWFQCENALNHITVQNWTSTHMSQTMEYWWAILPSWVVPNPCCQIANSMSPGLQCQPCQFHFILWTAWVLSKQPKMNIFTGCRLPRLVLHLISYNNNNNFQLSIIPKKQSYCASELHSYFWHGRRAFFKICHKFQKVIS